MSQVAGRMVGIPGSGSERNGCQCKFIRDRGMMVRATCCSAKMQRPDHYQIIRGVQGGSGAGTMNAMLWIAQILLEGIFLFTGMTKLFAYEKLTRRLESLPGRGAVTVTRAQAVPVGLLEIAGAIGVVMPPMFTEALAPDYLLVRLAAAGLMLLMVGAGIYHAK